MHFPAPTQWDAGWIEVICGSMFSGKTEELIRRAKRATIAKQRVQVFKPTIDDRFSTQDVVSHSEQKLIATVVEHPEQILSSLDSECRVVGVDEAQFFSSAIVDTCQRMADRGLRVIVAGLDLDYLGVPFGPMPTLTAIAEYVTKMHAICTVCGAPACRSQRIQMGQELPLVGSNKMVDSTIHVGAAESYEARCRRHFKPLIER